MIARQLALAAPWLLPAALALALLLYVRRRRRVARALGDPALVTRMVGVDLRRLPLWSGAAVLLAGLALGGALHLSATDDAGEEPTPGSGGPVVLVLDASNSMLVADLPPDRMTAQREAARRIAAAVPHAPVGIVIFAGRAYTLTPPTHDHHAIGVYLEALDPGMVTQEGSSLLAAVRQGVGLLVAGGEEATGGTLVLITDGDDPSTEAMTPTLELARRAGVVIHTVGAATVAGGPVPLPTTAGGSAGNFMTTPDGTPIISRLDDRALREIASATGGVYLHLDDADRIEQIMRRLPVAPGAGGDERRFPPAAWLTAVALLLLGAQTGLVGREMVR